MPSTRSPKQSAHTAQKLLLDRPANTFRLGTEALGKSGITREEAPGRWEQFESWRLNADATAGQYHGSVRSPQLNYDTLITLADGQVEFRQEQWRETDRSPAPANYLPEGTMELALRRGLPIASLDRELCAAAKAESIPVLAG